MGSGLSAITLESIGTARPLKSTKFPYTRVSERLLVREQEHGGGRVS